MPTVPEIITENIIKQLEWRTHCRVGEEIVISFLALPWAASLAIPHLEVGSKWQLAI